MNDYSHPAPSGAHAVGRTLAGGSHWRAGFTGPQVRGISPLTRACLRGPRTWGTRLKGVDAPISWSLVSGFRYAIDGRPGELLPEHATRARDR